MIRAAFAATLALGVLADPIVGGAQQAGKVYRVGVLSPRASTLGPLEAFRDRLRDLGYVDGRTVTSASRKLWERKKEKSPCCAADSRSSTDALFARGWRR